jgi:hypothetical protein
MIISNQRIRLAIDTSQMGTINDVLTGATPQFWNGVDLEFELAFFYGSTLLSVSNIDSITVDLKASDPRTGLPLMSQTVASSALNQALTLTAWNGGAPTDCHALVVFTNAETNLDLNDDSDTFWLVVSALTSDSPTHKIVLGATPITVVEGGEGVAPPASVVSPTYYTAAQSDARFLLAADLTSINTQLSTLNSEMTAVTATANAAMPKSGGTFTGAVTLTGLSGVLKANTGVVVGSATTSDLPEGTNQYWTSTRFNAAVAAISGQASGLCPLDSTSLVPVANLPQAAIRRTFSVSSQAAMLALSALQGDIAIRTDVNTCFVLTTNPATTLGNWAQLLAPAGTVSSVNSLSGAVVLTTTNITEGTNEYYTTSRVHTDALTAALTGFSNATGGNVTAGDDILVALGRLENRCALNDAKLTGSDRVKLDGSTAMTGSLTFSGTGIAGVVLNNLNDTQRAALTPSTGMIIYDTTLSQVMIYNGAWQALAGSGTSWFNGSGAPAASLGSNGAYYLDVSTGNVYLKSSGAWAIIYSPSTMLLSGNVFATTYNGTGSAPTIAVQSHAGTGATADLSTDANPTAAGFRVKLVTGTSGTTGALFTVTFPAAFSYKPKVVWNVNSTGYDGGFFVDYSTISTTGFSFSTYVALTSGQTFEIDFTLMG